jgi:hypothetical protein
MDPTATFHNPTITLFKKAIRTKIWLIEIRLLGIKKIIVQALNDSLSPQGPQGTIAMPLVATNGNFKRNCYPSRYWSLSPSVWLGHIVFGRNQFNLNVHESAKPTRKPVVRFGSLHNSQGV